MNTVSKKEKLNAVKEELRGRIFPDGYVKNVGSVFFVCNFSACVLRDLVFYGSQRFGLPFEVLCMDSSYFVGSKAHAEALKEAFGGNVSATEFCCVAEDPRELYTWEGPERREQIEAERRYEKAIPLDYEEVVEAMFI